MTLINFNLKISFGINEKQFRFFFVYVKNKILYNLSDFLQGQHRFINTFFFCAANNYFIIMYATFCDLLKFNVKII